MLVVDESRAAELVGSLEGPLLYVALDYSIVRRVGRHMTVVRRLDESPEELLAAIKLGLSHAPELVGYRHTVIEGVSLEEAEWVGQLERSDLGTIVYVIRSGWKSRRLSS